MILIVFKDAGTGHVTALTPPDGMTPDEVQHGRPAVAYAAATDTTAEQAAVEGVDALVPAGTTSFQVDAESLPLDHDIRSWLLSDQGVVTVDPNWQAPAPPALSPVEKLAAAGLSVADLKAALGLQ